MTTKSIGLVAVCALALTGGASTVSAQASAPTPAIAQGPAIPGLCIMSVEQAAATSTVGQYVLNRLNQLGQQVKAELGPEDAAIGADVKAFDATRATLDPATLKSRGEALQARYQGLQQKASLRQQELEATQKKAFNRISQELQPVVQQIYQQRHCSVLLNKEAVIIPNPSIDLTAEAVTALNGRIQQFAFDREHLDTAPPK